MQYSNEVTNEDQQRNQSAPEACYNRVNLTGTAQNHASDANGNHTFTLCVQRLSGHTDAIPVLVPVGLHANYNGLITVCGTFQSYNKIVGNRSKLMLYVIADEIVEADYEAQTNPNSIEMTAFICKAPIYRTTPFNREIADLLLAVNCLNSQNESSYIPAIAWGKNARFAKTLAVGEKVQILGRIQSREYQKRLDDNTVETRVAYEVSINSIQKEELL
jgi:primosomal replication protein N